MDTSAPPTSSPSGGKAMDVDELENMFDDDEEIEEQKQKQKEVESSVPVKSEQPAPPSSETIQTLGTSASDPEVVKAYYQRLFPWRTLFQWLNHSAKPTEDFRHREFAFTLQNDAYLRYQSFPNFETLRKDVLNLNPSRFEIGPVYSANPRDRKSLKKAQFRPIEKELVFDIDMTDYDEIRTCCSGASICIKCWQFITMAIKVLDCALRDDFGFQHVMWVYSGRRGVHAWVCDKRARKMDDSKRRAIATYLEVIKGGSHSGKKVNVKRPLHPHVNRSLDILKDSFVEDILINQDPWAEGNRWERLLQLLPDAELNHALRKRWDSQINRPSKSKWADIDTVAKTGASNTLKPKDLVEAKQDVILEYTYPRLDAEVSKHLNHLLKSPFVIHPGTGRVCVPIDIARLGEFDPEKVPTVVELLGQIDSIKSEPEGDDVDMDQKPTPRTQDYEKTALKPYIDLFKTFVSKLIADEEKTNGHGGDPMEF